MGPSGVWRLCLCCRTSFFYFNYFYYNGIIRVWDADSATYFSDVPFPNKDKPDVDFLRNNVQSVVTNETQIICNVVNSRNYNNLIVINFAELAFNEKIILEKKSSSQQAN